VSQFLSPSSLANRHDRRCLPLNAYRHGVSAPESVARALDIGKPIAVEIGVDG
jgi:hypothetical protein